MNAGYLIFENVVVALDALLEFKNKWNCHIKQQQNIIRPNVQKNLTLLEAFQREASACTFRPCWFFLIEIFLMFLSDIREVDFSFIIFLCKFNPLVCS